MKNKITFNFGGNWCKFLQRITPERIDSSKKSLLNMLKMKSLKNKSFLDIGSGSGLSSLAARKLGANVTSFDHDKRSVFCTSKLKNQFFYKDKFWQIKRGSILDEKFIRTLGTFDIVYAWGVLHHTGHMWLGIENSLRKVNRNGYLFIAIYNDQGFKSRVWWLIKWLYNLLPSPVNKMYAYIIGVLGYSFSFTISIARSQIRQNFKNLLNYKSNRGMSITHDLIDWIGGFPFECASYDSLLAFLSCHGFKLIKARHGTSVGCHEMVFRRASRESFS